MKRGEHGVVEKGNPAIRLFAIDCSLQQAASAAALPMPKITVERMLRHWRRMRGR